MQLMTRTERKADFTRLVTRLKEYDITQDQIAEATGYGQSMVSLCVSDGSVAPSKAALELLYMYCEKIGVEIK